MVQDEYPQAVGQMESEPGGRKPGGKSGLSSARVMPKGTTPLAVLTLAAFVGAAGPVAKKKPSKPAALAPGAVVVLDVPTTASRFTGEPISLDLKDADIRDVLKTFAKLGRFNLAIDPEVKGSVTVCLENVPWDQALDVILRMNGLGYVIEGNILRAGAPTRLADP
jgi:type II secretory pathway component HofQ